MEVSIISHLIKFHLRCFLKFVWENKNQTSKTIVHIYNNNTELYY